MEVDENFSDDPKTFWDYGDLPEESELERVGLGCP